MWAEYEDAPFPCEKGDLFGFPCNGAPTGLNAKSFSSCWRRCNRSVHDAPAAGHVLVYGILGSIWNVCSSLCAPERTNGTKRVLNEREQAVYNFLLKRSVIHMHRSVFAPSERDKESTYGRKATRQKTQDTIR